MEKRIDVRNVLGNESYFVNLPNDEARLASFNRIALLRSTTHDTSMQGR